MRIRPASEDDAAAVARIYRPIVEDTHVSFETTPPSTVEMAERIRATQPALPWLVCEDGDRVVGYAYASPRSDRPAYRWSVDVSVYVAADRRREGIARGLYRSLLGLLRLGGRYTAYAVIALPNPASVGFHEAVGFERAGLYRRVGHKGGEWRDVGHWELVLRDREGRPSPPRPLDELRGTAAYEEALASGEGALDG